VIRHRLVISVLVLLVMSLVLLPACALGNGSREIFVPTKTSIFSIPTMAPAVTETPTTVPERPRYSPGELVDYAAQSGDTLAALAARFHCKEEEIRQENPILPEGVTTLPAGLPLKIPIYYQSLWGSPFQILPDSLFINGPAQQDFDTVDFVNSQPGWLKDYIDNVAGNPMRGGAIIQNVANNFSVSPRLLLAIIEYQTSALSQPFLPESESIQYPLNFIDRTHRGLNQQLVLAANVLNNGYYGWRTGRLTAFEHKDGRLEQPDPWQNAASVGLQYYYAQVLSQSQYREATGSDGLLRTYQSLFGDPWIDTQTHIPGSLQQPELIFPFEAGARWNFTGGPHTGWGTGDPWAAIDFAPVGVEACSSTNAWVTAVTAGRIVRTGTGIAVLDLDGDGNEQTGWTIFYLHLDSNEKVGNGQYVDTRDKLGHPSCEGGSSTGTHVHLARKFNGEWIPADGAIPFVLEGWTVKNGAYPYQGVMERFGRFISASSNADSSSLVVTGIQ